MSYAQPNRNVTYIDDLPDLEDLESGGGMQGVGQFQQGPGNGSGPGYDQIPEQYKKFIRSSMGPPPNQSGMAPINPQLQQEFFQLPQHAQEPMRPPSNSPTCLDIHEHVQTCPICSRFFKNDNTMYIIAIVVLSIICILLLKRVLNL